MILLKRLSVLVALIYLLTLTPQASQPDQSFVNRFTATGSGAERDQRGLGINQHRITWNVSGTVSSCSVKLEQSADGSSWSDLIAGQTCTSNGVTDLTSGVANYVRITLSTFSGSGSPFINVHYGGWVDRSASGGAGTPGGSDTQLQFNDDGEFAGISGATTNGTVVTLTSPVLVTPALGTPVSGVATNLTGTAAGLTAGTVTTNANLTGPITSVGNATTVADGELSSIAGLTSAANKLPYYTGSGTAALADLSAAGRALIDDADAAAQRATLGLEIPALPNLIINGGFDFWQRQVATTATARSDDTYGPDRWNVLTQTAAINVERSTGDTNSQFAGKLTQNQSSAQRMGLEQILEAKDTLPLRSRAVIFQTRVKISNSQAVRCGLVEWTGTADTVTSDVVNDWTSSDYTDGGSKFFVDTSFTPLATASVTPSADAWTAVSVTATVGASANNLFGVCWTEGTAAQNVTLEFTQAGLYAASTSQNWNPLSVGQEYARLKRFVRGWASDATALFAGVGFGAAASTTTACIYVALDTPMRVVPTLVATAADWQLNDAADSGIAVTALSIVTNVTTANLVRLLVTVASGLTAHRPYQFLADGTQDRILVFDADL